MQAAGTSTLTSASSDLLIVDDKTPRLIIYTVMGALAAIVLWSAFAMLPEVSVGNGKVIPENRLQLVQSLDGGSVMKVLVKPGDAVKKGQTLAYLDPVYAKAQLNDNRQQGAALQLAVARIEAQLQVAGEAIAGSGDSLDRIVPDATGVTFEKGETRLSDLILNAVRSGAFQPGEGLAKSFPDLARQAKEQFQNILLELASSLAVIEDQITQKRLEKGEAASRLGSIRRSMAIAQDELEGLQRLLKSGAASRGEVNEARSRLIDIEGAEEQTALMLRRLDAATAELEGRLAERINGFRREAVGSLNDLQVKLNALRAAEPSLARKTANTTVSAPADGVLKSLKLSSAGQVVRPGDEIAEIVPDNSSLLIQVRIRPEDIAFVEPGMPAVIKLSAYDFSVFGSLKGKVEKVGGDSTSDEKGNSYYLIDVRADSDHLERRGESWPVKIGMTATVDVVTGHQSVFQYFTKPIHRMTQTALRER